MTDQQPSPPGLSINFDQLSTGDLEDMEDYCGQRVLPVLMQALDAADSDPQAMLSHLPAKVLTALLGVGRRQADPDFGPDRWRSLPFSAFADITVAGQPDPTPAATPPPTTPVPPFDAGA